MNNPEKSALLIKALEEGGSVQIGKQLAQTKAENIKKQLASIGLRVKLSHSLTLQEISEAPKEITQKNKQCPICDVPWGENEPQMCPSCKFAPRMATEESISRQRIAWEERKLIEAENKRLKNKSRQEMRDQEEAAIRRRIRQELEKEMKAQFSRQSLFHGRKGILTSVGIVTAFALIFAGGFWFGRTTEPTQIATQASHSDNNIVPEEVNLDLLPSSSEGEESLLALMENHSGQTQQMQQAIMHLNPLAIADNTADETITKHFDNPFVVTQHALQQPLSLNNKRHAIVDYVSTLLAIGNSSRADEVYQLAKQKSHLLHLSHADLHAMQVAVLASQLATQSNQQQQSVIHQELTQFIDALPEQSTQADMWIIAGEILAKQSSFSDEAFSHAQNIIKSLSNADIQKQLSQKQQIAQLKAAWLSVEDAARHGHWNAVTQYAQPIINTANSTQEPIVAFAAELLHQRTAILLGDVAALNKAEKMAIENSQKLKYSERTTSLLLWQRYADGLSSQFNQQLSATLQSALSDENGSEEHILQLWRACVAANQDACAQNMATKANNTASQLNEQKYFYALLDNIEPAYRMGRYAQAEVWSRMVFETIFRP